MIKDHRVLQAMGAISRTDFLPERSKPHAGEDRPLEIGEGQTTSQPSLIAWTLEQLHLKPSSRVLEVGTGCGYQTALLSVLCAEVYSVEIVEPLARQAAAALDGFKNVHLKVGDGYLGWPEAAPFDAIVVAAGVRSVPQPLLEQLTPRGRMIIPIGDLGEMYLVLVKKTEEGAVTQDPLLPVLFVPFTGPHGVAAH